MILDYDRNQIEKKKFKTKIKKKNATLNSELVEEIRIYLIDKLIRKEVAIIELCNLQLTDSLAIHIFDYLIFNFLKKTNKKVLIRLEFKNDYTKTIFQQSVISNYVTYTNQKTKFLKLTSIFIEFYKSATIPSSNSIRMYIEEDEGRMENMKDVVTTNLLSEIYKKIPNENFQTDVVDILGESVDNFLREKGDVIISMQIVDNLEGQNIFSYCLLSINNILLHEKFDDFHYTVSKNKNLSTHYAERLEAYESKIRISENWDKNHIKTAMLMVPGVTGRIHLLKSLISSLNEGILIESFGSGLKDIKVNLNKYSTEKEKMKTNCYIMSGTSIIPIFKEEVSTDEDEKYNLNFNKSLFNLPGVAYNMMVGVDNE